MPIARSHAQNVANKSGCLRRPPSDEYQARLAHHQPSAIWLDRHLYDLGGKVLTNAERIALLCGMCGETCHPPFFCMAAPPLYSHNYVTHCPTCADARLTIDEIDQRLLHHHGPHVTWKNRTSSSTLWNGQQGPPPFGARMYLRVDCESFQRRYSARERRIKLPELRWCACV